MDYRKSGSLGALLLNLSRIDHPHWPFKQVPLMLLVQVCVQYDRAVFFTQRLEHDLLHLVTIRNELFS